MNRQPAMEKRIGQDLDYAIAEDNRPQCLSIHKPAEASNVPYQISCRLSVNPGSTGPQGTDFGFSNLRLPNRGGRRGPAAGRDRSAGPFPAPLSRYSRIFACKVRRRSLWQSNSTTKCGHKGANFFFSSALGHPPPRQPHPRDVRRPHLHRWAVESPPRNRRQSPVPSRFTQLPNCLTTSKFRTAVGNSPPAGDMMINSPRSLRSMRSSRLRWRTTPEAGRLTSSTTGRKQSTICDRPLSAILVSSSDVLIVPLPSVLVENSPISILKRIPAEVNA